MNKKFEQRHDVLENNTVPQIAFTLRGPSQTLLGSRRKSFLGTQSM